MAGTFENMTRWAVLFDVDGVLVNSYQAHFCSWVALFAELGYQYSEEEFRAGFGRTSAEILHEWSQAHHAGFDVGKISELDDRKEKHYRDIICQNFLPIDGATELIDALHKANCLLGIGSSGPPENVQVVIERLSRAEHFGAVISRADVQRGKPDPEVFLLGAQRLNVSPSRCIVIEDASAGILAANAAGMASIGLTGTTTRQRLSAANLVVDSLRELTPQKIVSLLED